MATDTLKAESACNNSKIAISDLEDASSDLFVAAIMVDVTERSLCGIRAWVDLMGHKPANIAEILQVDTMLFEIKEKVRQAKAKIDAHVDATMADRRADTNVVS